MNQPYIQIPREFFNGDFWNTPRTYSFQEAMLDLAYMVAYQDRSYIINNKVLELKKGECVASLRFLGKRYNWSTKKVSGFLNTLKKTYNLTQIKKQGESILSFDISSTCEYIANNKETEDDTEDDTQEKRKRNKKETQKKQRGNKIKEGKESKEGIYKENNIKEILEARLLRIARCVTPKAELPRPEKELKAWAKISSSVTDEEIELIEYFYSFEKSDSYDETWNRKMKTETLMNNWRSSCELAQQLQSRFRDRKAEGLETKKISPPYFQNNEGSGDAASWSLNRL